MAGWRTCFLCGLEVEELGDVVLGRRCGHQLHRACIAGWSGHLYKQGAGLLCPSGCGWSVGSFDPAGLYPCTLHLQLLETRVPAQVHAKVAEALSGPWPRLAGPMGRTGPEDGRRPHPGTPVLSGPLFEPPRHHLVGLEAARLSEYW